MEQRSKSAQNNQMQSQTSAKHWPLNNMLATHKYPLTNPSDHARARSCPTDFTTKNPNLNASKLHHVGLDTGEFSAENMVIQ